MLEVRVRQAAADLAVAIRDAKQAGYSIEWPARPEGLEGIAISATARVIPVIVEPEPAATADEAITVDAPDAEEITAAPSDAAEPEPKKRATKPATDQ